LLEQREQGLVVPSRSDTIKDILTEAQDTDIDGSPHPRLHLSQAGTRAVADWPSASAPPPRPRRAASATNGSVAERLCFDHAVTLSERLERDGPVRRERSTHDRREVRLAITPHGAARGLLRGFWMEPHGHNRHDSSTRVTRWSEVSS
jgi:hypothetical protein